MENSKFRKILKDNIKANPFNDAFDFEYLMEHFVNHLSLADFEQDKLIDILKILPFLHNHYKNTYRALENIFFTANVAYDQLIELLFVVFNRNFFILTKRIMNEEKEKEDWRQSDYFSYKVQHSDPTMGKVEAAALLEGEVDSMNYVINYVRYFQDKNFKIDHSNPAVHPIEISKQIYFIANYYALLKEEYDESVWNGGYWIVKDLEGKRIMNIVFDDHELLILNKVGLLRLGRNISSHFLQMFMEVEKETPYGIYVKHAIENNKKIKRIKEINLQNGYIDFKLAKGFGKKDVTTELKNFTAYITYYPFLKNQKFQKIENLELVDLLKLFSLLQELLDKTTEVDFDDGIMSMDDLKKFPIKISSKRLFDYFSERSTYSYKQIKAFLYLVSFPFGARVNFWDRPMVRHKNNYYINFLATTAPMVLNLVDYCIEQAGYSLDKRGELLEKYLRLTVTKILKEKKYEFFIPSISKFQNKQKKFEEIDFLLNLKHIVIVAEVKCIKYPLEPRDKHNSLKTLTKAVNQIIRKIKFIEQWKDELSQQTGNIDGKEIIPLVITNYPIYSGYSINNIPICDFYLFEAYFKTGKMTEAKMYRDGNNETLHEHFYYRNENEMNLNAKRFFSNPYPISELKKLYDIVEFKTTLEQLPFQLFITSAQFKP